MEGEFKIFRRGRILRFIAVLSAIEGVFCEFGDRSSLFGDRERGHDLSRFAEVVETASRFFRGWFFAVGSFCRVRGLAELCLGRGCGERSRGHSRISATGCWPRGSTSRPSYPTRRLAWGCRSGERPRRLLSPALNEGGSRNQHRMNRIPTASTRPPRMYCIGASLGTNFVSCVRGVDQIDLGSGYPSWGCFRWALELIIRVKGLGLLAGADDELIVTLPIGGVSGFDCDMCNPFEFVVRGFERGGGHQRKDDPVL